MSKPKPKHRPRSAARQHKGKVHTITMSVPLKASDFAALRKMARRWIRTLEAEIDRHPEPRDRPVARARVRLLTKYLDHLHAALVRDNRVLKEKIRKEKIHTRIFHPLWQPRSRGRGR